MIENKLSNKFLKGIFSTGIGTLATIILSLVGIMIAVRYVSKEELGTYILMLTIVSSVDLVSDLGVNISTIKNLACCTSESKKIIVSTTFLFKLIVSITCCFLISIASKIFNLLLIKYGLFNYLPYVMLLVILECLNSYSNAVLQGYQKFKEMAFAKIILSLTNCCLIIALIRYLQLGIIGLIIIRIASLSLVMAYQVIILKSEIQLRFDKKIMKTILGFGYPLGLNSILSFIFLRLDTLMIGYFLNPMSVALYGIATKIPDAARQMFEAFRSVFFPNMSELFSSNKNKDAEIIMNNSIRIISFITIFIALIVYLFQNIIVKSLFSSNYIESAPVLSLLMLVLSIGLIGNIIGTSLVAAGYSRLPFIINIVDTITTITTNLILIPKFGVIGAAYAALISRIITNPVNVYFLRKYKINVDVLCYLKPICIYLICIAASYFINDSNFFINLFIAFLYIVLSFFFKIIKSDDFVHLLSGLNKQPAKGLV
ncbi:MAG TPA: oligosaccharide flippase family protein [Negativicutes bacterium]|jgi:O-antigen/teichoic acid export membrane protein